MTAIILTRGVPASGKSTFAKAWVASDPENRARVNRDNLRWTLGIKGGVGNQQEEREVTHWQQQMVRRFIEQGKSVIIDDTNLRARFVKDWLRLAKELGAEVEFRDFPITYEVAVARDYGRGDKEKVGPEVIQSFFNRYVKRGVLGVELPDEPRLEEGDVVEFKPAPEFDPELPNAIIVDIDGTLAHMTNRGPYDTSKYIDDSLDEVIADMVERYADDHEIIVVSGRSKDYESVLLEWLEMHAVWTDELYMRPSGDTRNDAIIKDELFEEHIAGKYNVKFILDDRDRVVKMWRAKGLKVLQVAEGNF